MEISREREREIESLSFLRAQELSKSKKYFFFMCSSNENLLRLTFLSSAMKKVVSFYCNVREDNEKCRHHPHLDNFVENHN